jgi:hypothetical protein
MPKKGEKDKNLKVVETHSATISPDGKTCHLRLTIRNAHGQAEMDYNGPVDPLFSGGLLSVAQASGGSITPQPVSAGRIEQQPPLLPPSSPPNPNRPVAFNTIDATAATVLPRAGLPVTTRTGAPLPTLPTAQQGGRPISPVQVAVCLTVLFFTPVVWALATNPTARQNAVNTFFPTAAITNPSPAPAPVKPKQSSALPPPPPPSPPAGSLLPVPTPP